MNRNTYTSSPSPAPRLPTSDGLLLVAAFLLSSLPATGGAQDDASDAPLAAASMDDDASESPMDATESEDSAAEAADEAAEAEEPESEPWEEGGRARIFEGTLAFTMQGYHLTTREDNHFSFYGPALELVGFLGPRWGFFADLAIFFPMRARQRTGDPSTGNIRETYDRNLGLDALLGAGVHRRLSDDLTITMGPGVHYNAIDLNDEDLVQLNNMTLGIGGMASVLWEVTDVLSIGGLAKMALDFIDLIHDSGRVAVGFTWSVGINAGLQFD